MKTSTKFWSIKNQCQEAETVFNAAFPVVVKQGHLNIKQARDLIGQAICLEYHEPVGGTLGYISVEKTEAVVTAWEVVEQITAPRVVAEDTPFELGTSGVVMARQMRRWVKFGPGWGATPHDSRLTCGYGVGQITSGAEEISAPTRGIFVDGDFNPIPEGGALRIGSPIAGERILVS